MKIFDIFEMKIVTYFKNKDEEFFIFFKDK